MKFKVGDKIKCITARQGLTYGKIYLVLGNIADALDGEDDMVGILDDDRIKEWYFTWRFDKCVEIINTCASRKLLR